jgi:hypothetical protein
VGHLQVCVGGVVIADEAKAVCPYGHRCVELVELVLRASGLQAYQSYSP